MTLPNCLMIGTAKSGTTTLKNLLNQHPDIGFAGEPNFFAKESAFCLGLERYESKFEAHREKRIIGEKSWRYSCKAVYPKAKDRIISTLGKDIKLIYVVRHPFERLQSLYIEFITGGLQDAASLKFTESLKQNPLFLDSSKYWTQISHYMKDFNAKNIKIIFFDDLKSSPTTVVNDLFSFLEIEPCLLDLSVFKSNASQGKLAETKATILLRKYPQLISLGSSLPEEIKLWSKKILKKKVLDRPKYDSDTIEWLTKELSAEVSQILNYCDKPQDFWKLDKKFV